MVAVQRLHGFVVEDADLLDRGDDGRQKVHFLVYLQKVFIGVMINSSAGIQPHCLSAEFAFRQTSHYYMCFFTSLQKHGKNFFRKLIFAAKSFYRRTLWKR